MADPRALRSSSNRTRAVYRVLSGVIQRVYAFVLIAVILWASYSAIAYLVGSLLIPAETPSQVRDVPRKLDKRALFERREDWAGLAAVERPRAPLAHYHQIDTWFQSDAFNDCTRSGCHSPAPHDRFKETRAFLNMHATALHCGVCHFEAGPPDDTAAMPLTWYDLQTGAADEPPALLIAYAQIEAALAQREPLDRAARDQLADLLETAAERGADPGLARAVGHFRAAASRADDPLTLLRTLRARVQRAFRGTYGTKLAVRSTDGRALLGHPTSEEAVAAYLSRVDDLDAAEREERIAAIHTRRRETPLACAACHAPDARRIDWEALGYSRSRISELQGPLLFQMIEHIRDGRPFVFPQLGQPAPQ